MNVLKYLRNIYTIYKNESAVEPLPACPDGGEEWGDSCYSFYSEELTKQEAEGKCSGNCHL